MLDTLLVSTWQYLESFHYLFLPAGCLSLLLVIHNSKQEVANALPSAEGGDQELLTVLCENH